MTICVSIRVSVIIGAAVLGANLVAATPVQPSEDSRPAARTTAVQPDRSVPAIADPAVPLERNQDLAARLRQANEDVFTSLQSFVCSEQIERFRGKLGSQEVHPVDTVLAKVSFENGVEHYTDIRQNSRPRPSISSLVGAWSEGEFGTLLRQTALLLETQTAVFQMYADLNGTPAAVYTLDVSEENSPWDLEIASKHFQIPFRTELWVARDSGQIVRIERISTGVPWRMGISEIRWGVTLEPVELNGRRWLLPTKGDYAVFYQESGRHEWNKMTFSNYHRYGSEVALHF
jgi:hypothetical protein